MSKDEWNMETANEPRVLLIYTMETDKSGEFTQKIFITRSMWDSFYDDFEAYTIGGTPPKSLEVYHSEKDLEKFVEVLRKDRWYHEPNCLDEFAQDFFSLWLSDQGFEEDMLTFDEEYTEWVDTFLEREDVNALGLDKEVYYQD